jgi:RsmE family RNA methyltransferase
MNRIILTEQDRVGDGRFRLNDNRADHIRTVLKTGPGGSVRVGMLNGPIGTGEIVQTDPRTVELVCQFSDVIPQMRPTVDVICAVPRPKTLKKVLFTAAMMGVRRLMMVRANRTDKSYLSSPLLTSSGWMPYLFDGLAQGGLTLMPEISVHPLFRPFVEDELPELVKRSGHELLLLPDPEAASTLTSEWGACDHNHILVAIGPESGWVPFELSLLEQQGFARFSLGPWTLRVESALTAVLGQIQVIATKGR